MQHTILTRNGDFVRAYRKGKSYVHPQVVLYINKNKAKQTRVGITASKKVGNAVKRNRARRVIRHAVTAVLPVDAGSYDFVFVARGKTPYCKSFQLEESVKKLLLQAGIKTII